MACSTDFDCPEQLVCFKNVSWAKESIFCGCSTYYGWEGPDCTNLSQQGKFYLGTNIALIVFNAIPLLMAVNDSIRLYMNPETRKLSKGVRQERISCRVVNCCPLCSLLPSFTQLWDIALASYCIPCPVRLFCIRVKVRLYNLLELVFNATILQVPN